jgi:hypothetical protein
MNISSDTKVADLTVGELQQMIHQAISRSLADPDPDVGLQLREEFIADLMQPEPEGRVTIEELAKEFGFKWFGHRSTVYRDLARD